MDIDRTKSIGGSQAAAAAGLHPYCSPIQLFQELRGELAPFAGNERTRWGHLLEGIVRSEYVEREGCSVVIPDEPLWHPEHEWARATPDGIRLTNDDRHERIVEIKTAGLRAADRWGEPGSDDIPPEYYCQVAWYMWIADLPRADVALLLGGQDFAIYRVERDDEFIEALVETAHHFWEQTQLGIPPDPDYTDDYSQYLLRRYAQPRKEYLQASVELDERIVRLRDVKAQLKDLEREKAQIENEIHAAVGDASGVECSIGRLQVTRVKGRTTVDYQAACQWLAASLGLSDDRLSSVLAQHTKQGAPHRRLTLREAK